MKKMHYRGQIWRPPYEANSVLLQVTSGCTHDDCRFCSLYYGTKFRMSPISEIIDDLLVVNTYQPQARRVFLTGANPFVLSFNKLVRIAELIKEYLPEVRNIGSFARVSDIKNKTVEQLKELRKLGYDRISIGTETGDDITLLQMNKGNTAKDTLEQCRKLDAAGIEYNFTYVTGLAGKGNSERNAIETAKVFSQLHPFVITVVSLTIFPESELYQDMQKGLYTETPEIERLKELKTLINNLNTENEVTIMANTVSNPIPLVGVLPKDKKRLMSELQSMIDNIPEKELKRYRNEIVSL